MTTSQALQDRLPTAPSAKECARIAEKQLYDAIDSKQSFVFEAGAGAGKTYSLIQALRHILREKETFLRYDYQQIACVTYTNVACNEITDRTEHNEKIVARTIHSFLWELIAPFQKDLRREVRNLTWVQKKLDDTEKREEYKSQLDTLPIVYQQGIPRIGAKEISLRHDDIPLLGSVFLKNPRFQALMVDKFPIIFVDEYQDTHDIFAKSLITILEEDSAVSKPLLGFFGDHWQQIYDNSIGIINSDKLQRIQKGANFRSSQSVVAFLNHLRPELPQRARDDAPIGSVRIFHTNSWPGKRMTGAHYKGQIRQEDIHRCMAFTEERILNADNPEENGNTRPKILLLTNRFISNEVGFPSLIDAFKGGYSDLSDGYNPFISFFLNTLIPALELYKNHKYAQAFTLLNATTPVFSTREEQKELRSIFEILWEKMQHESVGNVIDFLIDSSIIPLPNKFTRITDNFHNPSKDAEGNDVQQPDYYPKLRNVPFAEMIALSQHASGSTPFCTLHSTKGAEYDHVLVVLGAGWSQYHFPKLLDSLAGKAKEEDKRLLARTRNLFYVASSRAKQTLTLLFVRELNTDALNLLEEWVGTENIHSILFDENMQPFVEEGRGDFPANPPEESLR